LKFLCKFFYLFFSSIQKYFHKKNLENLKKELVQIEEKEKKQ
jgi:hypothetical protein